MRALLLAGVVAAASACNPLYYVGVKFVYKRAPLPDTQVVHDVSYDLRTLSLKQRLDLYLPSGRDWPTVVFVHGGSWTSGDRELRVGGADVYANIGRFLAGHGYGAAVISYRLLPTVDWRAQANDVVQAVAWTYSTIGIYGGRRDAIFLMGHSAGAQLAARTALDTEALTRAGVPPQAIRGVIAVSGAGYDLTDQQTYTLGNDPRFFAARFQLGADDTDWQKEASVVPLITPKAPPFLLIYAGGETKPLQRQSMLLHDDLQQAGVPSQILAAPGLSHTRIVPTLSRADRPAGAAILAFISQKMK